MMDADELEDMRNIRRKNFRVKVVKNKRWPDFPDERIVSFTFNGNQWTTTSFNRDEAAKVVAALRKAFRLTEA